MTDHPNSPRITVGTVLRLKRDIKDDNGRFYSKGSYAPVVSWWDTSTGRWYRIDLPQLGFYEPAPLIFEDDVERVG